MHTPAEFTLLTTACRWGVLFASRAPRPLFASPGFHFRLSAAGLPRGCDDAFLTRYAVAKHPPERFLQRFADRLVDPHGSIALCYALDEEGDLHAMSEQIPAQLLVYLHVPSTATYCRRLLRIDPDARRALVLPDRVLPFDLRFLPALNGRHQTDVDAFHAELRVH
jgi:hypothetical protein